jgi:hypothetical protein
VAFDDETRLEIPAKFRPGHLYGMLIELENLRPGQGRAFNVDLLHRFAESTRRKGMMVIISDFFCDLGPLTGVLEHLRFRGHDVILFQIMDDREINFDFERLTRFVGLEGEAMTLGMPQDMKRHYLDNLQKHLEGLRATCGIQRIDYNLLRTSQPLDFALQAYLAARSGKS